MARFPQSIPQLLAIIDAAPVAMIMIDQNGAINFVNAEAERLFGYSQNDFLGRTIEMLLPERLRHQHPALRKAFFANHQSRRMGEGRDLLGLRKDGTEFPVEIGLRPVETSGGVCVVSAIVDITERKRLEAVLQQSSEAMARTNQKLQQFAYIASHDLQTPLRTISGFVQLLQMNYEDKFDSRARDWIRRTVGGVKTMHTLITDILAYAQLDSVSQARVPTDFQEIFDEAVGLLGASICDSGAQVTCGKLPALDGDRLQLLQLMQNLIGNGIKYHAGGDPPPRIHVAAAEHDGEWFFSVRDNGIGIDSKHHEKIFDIFKRLHTEQAYPGTGIGLAICRRVVENHGGRIWVESELGKGSVFYFTISRNMKGNL